MKRILKTVQAAAVIVAFNPFFQTPTFVAVGMGAGVVVVSAVPAEAKCRVTVKNPCTPDDPAFYQGTDHRDPPLKPPLCINNTSFDTMTIAIQNGKKVRLPAKWDYGLYYGKGRQPEVYPNVVRGQCQTRQKLHPGTQVLMWFNCLDRKTGKWIRHWLATKPVRDNSEYVLEEYYTEEVTGFEDEPKTWVLPQ